MKPKLHFTPAGTNEGFRSAGLSIYSNLDPDTLLREIFQNAVDAAVPDKVIQVRLHFDTIRIDDIPAYRDYQIALEEAIQTQNRLGALHNARNVTDAMQHCLAQEEITVLWVVDNGCGLSYQNMNSLLGDGQSSKEDASKAGAYGNGHITVFPASDLRYLLYGGVFKDEGRTKRIYSGHAILASRESRKTAYGKDGYLLQKLRADDLFDRFEFCNDSNDSPLLLTKLDEIEKEMGTGSCVGILGFNHFNRELEIEQTIKTIERVASVHFLPLVFERKLEMQVRIDGEHVSSIHRDRLHEILFEYKDQRRRRNNSIGPTGGQSWATLDAHESGERVKIPTKLGDIDAIVKNESNSDTVTNVQLFRSGMWITNKVPRNEPHRFQDQQAFTAVLCVDPESAQQACELIRDCEGPRHIDILRERLNKNPAKVKNFTSFFDEIFGELSKITPKKSTDEFDPGFLLIDGLSGAGRGKAANGNGRFETGNGGGSSGHGGRGGGGSGKGKNANGSRIGRPVDVRSSTVVKDGIANIVVYPNENVSRLAMRLKIKDGVDATCDTPLYPDFLEIRGKVKPASDSVEVLDPQSTNADDKTVVELRHVKKDSQFSTCVEVNFSDSIEPLFFRVSESKKTNSEENENASDITESTEDEKRTND